MGPIYKPTDRAREYAEFALNIYLFCPHGCKYCYVPALIHKTREAFLTGAPRRNILLGLQEQLERDKTLSGKEVLLSFLSDPYPPIEEELEITRQAIKELHGHGAYVRLLTKSGMRATRDFDLLGKDDWFGVTLTCLTRFLSEQWEPHAASPAGRIESLRLAKEANIGTWVSLEPVINPGESLEIIQRTHAYVDEFKVGKLNYHPLAATIDWQKFVHEAVELLEKLHCKYYIKADLRKFLE